MTRTHIHGDAMEMVADAGTFDYIITDPPYPTGASSNVTANKAVTQSRFMLDSVFHSFFMEVFRKVNKADNFACWIFTDWRQVSFISNMMRMSGLDKQSCIVWDKTKGSFSANYHPSHEMVVYASNFVHKCGYLGRDLIQAKRPQNKRHPYEKPVDLIVDMCKKFPKGHCIDPFAGSGSTADACEILGWDCTTIEIASKEHSK